MKKLSKIIIISIIGAIVALSCVNAKGIREKDKEIKQRYKQAKEQYLREVNFYKSFRQQFISAREKYRKLRNSENKSIYQKRAKLFLEKIIDVLIKRLEALKRWISNRRGISDTEKQNIIAEIEQDINWLSSKKSEIPNASPEEIRATAKQIREYWKNHRIRMKRIICKIWRARLLWTIERFENVSEKISDKIEKLEEEGKDTSKLEEYLNEFNKKIELAKEKCAEIKEKCEGISNLKEANQFFSQAHQFAKQVNSFLKQAHKKLIEIVKELKNMG